MSGPNDVRDLLAPMTDRETELDGEGFKVDRARIVAQMARIDARDRRLRGIALAFAAACVAAIVVGLWLRARAQQDARALASSPLEVVVSEGHATHIDGTTRADVPTVQSAHLAASGELETGDDSRARVRTADGLQIELQSHTRVALGQLQSADNQVTLLEGAIRCTIPHRSAPHRFLVVGPAFTVIDVGTVFTVTVDAKTHTSRVSVEEGEVLVQSERGQTRVTAPGTWSADRPDASPDPSAAPVASPPTPASIPSGAPSHALPRRPLSPPPPATLDAESQLLRRGLAAERQGAFPEAIAALTTLLTKYPNSPLAPDARAALDRVKARARQ